MNEDFWITYPVIPIDYGPTIEKTTANVVYSSDDTSRQAPMKTYQQAPLPERMCPIGDEQGRNNVTSCQESVFPSRRDVNQGYNNIIEEAIAMVNASNCDSMDFWKTMRMDPLIKNREMTNSHLRPTGKILNEGTPWSCYVLSSLKTAFSSSRSHHTTTKANPFTNRVRRKAATITQ